MVHRNPPTCFAPPTSALIVCVWSVDHSLRATSLWPCVAPVLSKLCCLECSSNPSHTTPPRPMKTLMQILHCPDCGKLLASRFALHECHKTPKTRKPKPLSMAEVQSGKLPCWAESYAVYFASLPAFSNGTNRARWGRIRAMRALGRILANMLPAFTPEQRQRVADDIRQTASLKADAYGLCSD